MEVYSVYTLVELNVSSSTQFSTTILANGSNGIRTTSLLYIESSIYGIYIHIIRRWHKNKNYISFVIEAPLYTYIQCMYTKSTQSI